MLMPMCKQERVISCLDSKQKLVERLLMLNYKHISDSWEGDIWSQVGGGVSRNSAYQTCVSERHVTQRHPTNLRGMPYLDDSQLSQGTREKPQPRTGL